MEARKQQPLIIHIASVLIRARVLLTNGPNTRARPRGTISTTHSRFHLLSLPVAVLLLVINAWGQQVIRETFPERSPSEPQALQKQAPAPASLHLAGAFREGLNVYDLGPVSAEQLTAADRRAAREYAHVHPRPRRVGLVRSLGAAPLSIEKAALHVALPDGTAVWTLAIRSPGAFGIRIHFTHFRAGSVLVYARVGDDVIVRGPYTGKGPDGSGDFWTASLLGDTVFIEVSGSEAPRLEIPEILHFDKNPAGPVQEQEEAEAAQLPCHLDPMCYGSPPVHPAARDVTGQMNFVKDGSAFVCTGTLLNDLDGETAVPYFLTAYHCLHAQAVINTLEVVWFWQRNACGGALPNYATLPRTTGGTLLETNPTDGGNDMTFIRLNGIPGGVGLAGWTTDSPDTAYGIHHPRGSWKRVTFLSDVGFCPGCAGCGDPTDYDYYDIDNGVIEPGSSGSGVFNGAGQLAGQLFGLCCPSLSCAGETLDCSNTDEFATMYGEFETTFPIIKRWLEIGGTIHIDGSYSGDERGTPSQPFNTVIEAHNFAWNGARIKIQAGSYPETLTLSKRLTVLASGGTVTIGQ